MYVIHMQYTGPIINITLNILFSLCPGGMDTYWLYRVQVQNVNLELPKSFS